MKKKYYLMSLLLGVGSYAMSQTVPSMSALHDGIHHWNLEHKERNYKRYSPEQYTKIADNFVAYQNEDGGWPKNIRLDGRASCRFCLEYFVGLSSP